MSKQFFATAILALQCFHLLAAAGDEQWNQGFSSPIGGEIRSITPRNGEIYAVGDFSTADGNNASYAAKWNGTSWSAVAQMGGQAIDVVATNASAIYFAGRGLFVQAPSPHFAPVVSLSGSIKSAVGTGLTSMGDGVSAMHGTGSELFIAGSFAINNNLSYIGRWNGGSWQSLANLSPISPGGETFHALTKKGTDLFVAGSFRYLSTTTVSNVARWNGTNWFSLGTGLNDTARALAVIGNDVYVGGDFTTANGVSANRIAKWNGTTWSALGTGLNGRVTTLTAIGTDLYVGGEFSTAGAVSSPKLAKWNGTTWSAVNVQVVGSIKTAACLGTDLYVGGAIDSLNNTNTGNIFAYSATTGSSRTLKKGVSGGHVDVLRAIGNDIYAGGTWRNLAGTNCQAIARWDGLKWAALGSGLSNSFSEATVYDIISRSNEVVVAGFFETAGGLAVTNVARWDGTNWQKLGNGLGRYGEVYALAQRGSELFAGGGFNHNSLLNIARLSGSNWVSVGSSSPTAPVNALAVLGNDLYVGGYFTSWPVSGSSYLAKWNGSAWSEVGSQPLNGPVQTLTVVGTNLYVGGAFTTIGGLTVNRIAKWDGTTWSALGSGLTDEVLSILPVGNDLYVGGYFGGASGNRIARWNGTSWSVLGSGISGTDYPQVRALVAKGNDLLAGGTFTSGGGLPTYNFAAWGMQPPALLMSKAVASASISWPAGFIPYQLQSATALSSPSWTNVPQPTALSNGNLSVTTNLSQSSSFFRLRSP